MKEYCSEEFQYPSTRYSGSKRRLLDWIWENIRNVKFSSALDVFGGTASISLMLKRYGKQVHYNDLLKFNQIIATAIIENSSTLVTEEDINNVFSSRDNNYSDFIQREFEGLFFLDQENIWIDQTVLNICAVKNKYKRAILMASLFQACLTKRPFNLFHRANLYIRTANVERTFGNKTTWEQPFPLLLKKYVEEYNQAVFSNDQKNSVIGGFDALSTPNGVDLVYLDPPYVSGRRSYGTDYLTYYHFLEGLADYQNWSIRIDRNNKIKNIVNNHDFEKFSRRDDIANSFFEVLRQFQDNILVISYLDNGVPSREEILDELIKLGKKVKIYEKPHKYALSNKQNKELLFVAK